MEEVCSVIKGWWDELEGARTLRRFRAGVVQQLAERVRPLRE
jgi:hypothetical protein